MDGRFGDILRETRERKGLDLTETARRLRIRPDILRAIEDSNFAAMPPRGYARNMVNGYARFLGLNATEVTGLYLDQLTAYQQGIARSRARGTGFDMSDAGRAHARRGRSSRSSSGHRGASRDGASPRQGRRVVVDDWAASTRYGPTNTWSSRPDDMQGTGGRSRRTGSKGRDLGYLPGGSASSGFFDGILNLLRGRLLLVIAALAAVVVIIVLVGMFSQPSQQETVTTMPVTGLDEESTKEKTVETAPTKFTFQFTVADGATSYIEVYIDDVLQDADTFEGPVTKSYDCTGELEFVCASTEGVTATVDGEEQALETNDNGIVDATYTFKDVLAAWQQEHASSSTTTSTTTDTSSSADSD